MFKIFRYILGGFAVIVCVIGGMSCAFAKDVIFHGKVIDADTKEPIDGAVVVAFWYEARATIAGESTRLEDVKETLTDKNGEWSIIGPKGKAHDPFPPFSFITGIHYTRHPEFIVFKPGYCSWPKGFFIEACKGEMKPGGIGGIMDGENVELAKLTKREDRLRNLPEAQTPSDETKYMEFMKKQKEFLRLKDEERKNLGLSEMYKEFKNEK